MNILRYFSLLLLATSQIFAVQARTDHSNKLAKVMKADAEMFAHHEKSKDQEGKKRRVKVTCDTGTRFICQKNVGTQGLVITEPGEYCLIEDINFAPESDTANAITVATSNVRIDLQGRHLIQVNNGTSNIGIAIEPNVRIVEIVNGVIENFGAFGIFAASGTQGIRLETITTFACGNRGHAPYATPDNFQTNGLSFMAGGIGIAGLLTPGGGILEVEIVDCRALATQNSESTAFDPVSRQNVAVVAVGIGVTVTTGLLMENNVTGTIVSTQSTARGLTISTAATVNIQNHQATNILHFQGGTGILLDSVTSAVLSTSYVDNVQDLGGVDLIQRGSIGVGVLLSTDINIEDSTITRVRNTASVTGVAHGLDIRNSTNVFAASVRTFDSAGTAPLVHVAGIAYFPASVTPPIHEKITVISESSALGCSSVNGSGFGITIEPLQTQATPLSPIVDQGFPQGLIVEDGVFSSNSTAGIRLRDANKCEILRNEVTENGDFGIELDRTAGVTPLPCHIGDNIIDYNGQPSFGAGVIDGYFPGVPSVSNMYINNEAFNNHLTGRPPSNYVSIPTPGVFTPMVTWDINAGLPMGNLDQKFANLDARST